jgi:hypothetical protein
MNTSYNDILTQENKILNCGNYLVSISTYKSTDVAIVSKFTREFVQFKNIRKKSKLEKIKNKFKKYLCSDTELYFSFKQEDKVEELIKLLN